jgi:hypothetical protein
MKWKAFSLALVICAIAGVGAAQTTEKTTRETTVQNPDGSKTVTVTGEVVRYEPGQTIVLREPDQKEVTFTIRPNAAVPNEVQVGRRVTLMTEPSPDGSGPSMVTRITTTSVNSEGQTKTTTEQTETSPAGETKTTTTTVYGTVSVFQPGQTLVLERPDHQKVTLSLDAQSELPQDLAVGKTVTVTTTTVKGSRNPFVRKVTYKTVTSKTVSPQ